MNTKIQSIHFNADQKLLDFIGKKVDKLRKYNTSVIGCEVFLKIDKSDSLQNKVVEIRLQIPGNDLFVKRQCQSFEEATDQAAEVLTRQLKKHKEKMRRSLNKKGRVSERF